MMGFNWSVFILAKRTNVHSFETHTHTHCMYAFFWVGPRVLLLSCPSPIGTHLGHVSA